MIFIEESPLMGEPMGYIEKEVFKIVNDKNLNGKL